MRYKIKLKGSKEDIFHLCLLEVESGYYAAKNKHLSDLKEIRGTTFQVPVKVGNKVDASRSAVIKITDYVYPEHFSFDYRSSTYHKISEFSFAEPEGDYNVLLLHSRDERLSNGKVTKTGKDSDEYRSSLMLSMQMRRALKQYIEEKNRTTGK